MLPILFQSESLTLYTYPLMFALAWASGVQYIWYQLKKGHKDFIYFCVLSFLAAWAGAKLVFLLSIPQPLVGLIDQFNFWTGGGFVFYGGMLAGLIIAIAWKLMRSKPFNMSLLIPAVCLGHAIGRVGCFLTGCCFGHPMSSGALFPVALVESGFLFAVFVYFHKNRNRTFFDLGKDYLALYATVRFGLEYLRADQVRGIFGVFSTSQWISLSLIIIYPILNLFSFIKLRSKRQ